MRIYLDASVLVPLFILDALNDRAETLLMRAGAVIVVVSDFAAAEFASALARRVRMGELATEEARTAFTNMDAWVARVAIRTDTRGADVAAAEGLLRRLDLPLRTPDALHIAIARRVDGSLATFDLKMAGAAQSLGLLLAQ